MPSLPTPGGDAGTWGTELNEFLQVAHGSTGLLDVGSNAVGALTVNDTGTIIGQATWDAAQVRTAKDLSVAGTGVAASANEAVATIQTLVPATSSGASYEKMGLFVRARTADPSTATLRDLVGIDCRGEIASSNATGRAWAFYAEAEINSGGTGDGLLYAGEFQTDNNGTDQASTGTTTSKYGLHVVATGTQPSTAALFLNASASGLWHKGLIASPTSMGVGASDTFLELVGKFSVNSQTGKTLVGSTSVQIAASKLEVLATAGTSTGTVNIYGVNATDNFTVRVGNAAGSVDWFAAGGAGAYLTGTASGDTGMRVLVSGKAFHLGGNAAKVVSVGYADTLGFFAATPVAKPTVSGSRAGNAALADLLTELATLGLITDSSSA